MSIANQPESRSAAGGIARVGRALDRSMGYLSYAAVVVGMVCVVVMVAMVTLGVIMRQGFNKPLLFVDEFGAYMFVVIVYMGLGHCARRDKHISVDLVVGRLPTRARDTLTLITLMLTLLLMGIYFKYNWSFFADMVREGRRASTFYAPPLWIPTLFLWLGVGLWGLETIVLIVKKIVAMRKAPTPGKSQEMPRMPAE